MSHDPWARLELARQVFHERQHAAGWRDEYDRLAARIDAALAEHADSATPVVEWRPADQRVFLDGVSLRVVLHTDGLWVWSVYWPLSHRTEQGRVATEAEAKSAATAAARGVK